MNFCSGGIVEGTIQESSSAPSSLSAPSLPAAAPRPPGIPEHYVFDTDVELWMPPSAIKKADAAAAKASASSSTGGVSHQALLVTNVGVGTAAHDERLAWILTLPLPAEAARGIRRDHHVVCKGLLAVEGEGRLAARHTRPIGRQCPD